MLFRSAELAVFDIQSFYEKLAHEKMQMNRRMEARLERAKQKEEYLAKQLQLLSPENQMNSKRQYAMDLEERLGQLMQRTLRENQHRLELLAGALDGLSPAKKLSQGYSVVRNRQGKNIRKTEDVKTGETLQIHVTDGTIEAEVTAVKEN